MFNGKPSTTIVVPVLVLFLLLAEKAVSAPSCGNIEKAAWGMTNTQFNRMVENAELPKNKKLSRKVKAKRIKDHMVDTAHSGLNDISATELSQLITEVADCTGVDFSFFAGILHVESKYCLDRYNEDSKASGCGQFTDAPVEVYKNQLRLPGRDQNGHPRFKEAIETLLNRCYKGDEEDIAYFKDVFSKSVGQTKIYLRKAGNFKLDLIASAIFFKFSYARAGFYYDPETPDPGAVKLYSTEPGYTGEVMEQVGQIEKANYDCGPDDEYLKAVGEASCALSADPRACDLVIPTYDI